MSQEFMKKYQALGEHRRRRRDMIYRAFFLVVSLVMVAAGEIFAHEGHGEVVAHFSSLSGVPWGIQGLSQVMNPHPIFVHFPIAMLLMASFFYWVGVVFKKESLLHAAKWELYAGTFFALLAVITGLWAARTVPHDEEVHQILVLHQYLGFIILLSSVFLSGWVFFAKASPPKKGSWTFLVALIFLSLIIVQQGDFGGRMVFLHGTGVGQKSMLTKRINHEH